jgi:hypothetical protein
MERILSIALLALVSGTALIALLATIALLFPRPLPSDAPSCWGW